MEGIKKGLGLTSKDEIKLPEGGGVTISGPSIGDEIPLEAWADGYRMTLIWMLDLYAWAMRARAINEDGDPEGILLIDELEQHLHPSMQTFFLRRIGELFPRMQLIATTHSPLAVLGVSSKSELIVLKRYANNVRAERSIPDFTGYSVEDIIKAVELFASPTYSESIENMRREYDELAEKPKRTPRESKKWQDLSRQLSNARLLTPEDGPVTEALSNLRKELGLSEQ